MNQRLVTHTAYDIVCKADLAIRGADGALRQLNPGIRPNSMAAEYLRLTEALLRELTEAVAHARAANVEQERKAA